jgi:hypothetical protein
MLGASGSGELAEPGRTVDLQPFVAKRTGATTVETASSHVPMLSNPALVLDVIRAVGRAAMIVLWLGSVKVEETPIQIDLENQSEMMQMAA